MPERWREGKREKEPPPPLGDGHTAILSSPFLHPVRILGMRTHIPGVFFRLPGPDLNHEADGMGAGFL